MICFDDMVVVPLDEVEHWNVQLADDLEAVGHHIVVPKNYNKSLVLQVSKRVDWSVQNWDLRLVPDQVLDAFGLIV